MPFIKLYLVHFVIERTLSRIRLEACFQSIPDPVPGVKETLAGADLVEKDTMDSFCPIRQLGHRFNPSVDARLHLFRSRSECFSFRDDRYDANFGTVSLNFDEHHALVANDTSDFFLSSSSLYIARKLNNHDERKLNLELEQLDEISKEMERRRDFSKKSYRD